jgi:very-short-patch-repair endonuclease
MAAALWGGEGAAVSHLTAAVLRDLVPSASPTIHITVASKKRSRRGLRVHQVRRLDPRDVTVRDGIPVTSLARTLLDIAETESPARLERALEQAERMKRLDFRELEAVLRRNPGRRGLKALTAAVKDFDPQAAETNVGLERDFLRFLKKYRLPQPQINVSVGPYVVDFLWEDRKLIVEADSYQHHRGRATFESDRKRDIALKLAGYTVIRLTRRRLKEEPAAVAEELQAFLSASSPGCSSQG